MGKSTRLIGLVGKKQVGKDTVFKLLMKLEPGAVRLAFADPMKAECAKALGVAVQFMDEHKDVFRPFYQWYGTEFRRGLFGDDYWINKARMSLDWYDRSSPLIVFTDCRFANEAELIRSRGGRIWRVVRGDDSGDDHASETEQDSIEADNCIMNNGTMEQLRYCVESVYRSEFRSSLNIIG